MRMVVIVLILVLLVSIVSHSLPNKNKMLSSFSSSSSSSSPSSLSKIPSITPESLSSILPSIKLSPEPSSSSSSPSSIKLINEDDVYKVMSSSSSINPINMTLPNIFTSSATSKTTTNYESPLQQIKKKLNLSPLEQIKNSVNNFNIDSSLLSSPTPSSSSLSSVNVISDSDINSTVNGVQVRELAYFYLNKELKIPESTLLNVMMKNSWVMYLRVDTNLRPTTEVFKSFGFRDKDLRAIIQIVPSVLAINHEWTLPEKLISIQKMFHLSPSMLVKVIVSQPLLLTSSIDRNLEVSTFLHDDVGLSQDEVKNLVNRFPTISMTAISVLSAAWSVLTDVYRINPKDARKLCLRYPPLLSKAILKEGSERLKFFNEDLSMPAPHDNVRKLILRFPQLLCISVEIFLKPNILILKKYLGLTNGSLSKMIAVFPQLLGYNPQTLEVICNKSLRFLSGLDEFKFDAPGFEGNDDTDDEEVDISDSFESIETTTSNEDDVIVNEINRNVRLSSQGKTKKKSKKRYDKPKVIDDDIDVLFDDLLGSDSSKDSYIKEDRGLDIIADIVSMSSATKSQKSDNLRKKFDRRSIHMQSMQHLTIKTNRYMSNDMGAYARGAASEIEAIRMILISCATLGIDKETSRNIAKSAPWILSYRPERSKRVVAALAVSLGMTKSEIAKCVTTYPRLLSLSIDGKLTQLLRYLSELAVSYLDRKYKNISPHVIEKYIKLKGDIYETSVSMDDGDIYDDVVLDSMEDEMVRAALINRRSNAIRSMVRFMICKYPLILGTSIEKIEDRLSELGNYDVEWINIITFLRRSSISHDNWIKRYKKQIHEEELFSKWKNKEDDENTDENIENRQRLNRIAFQKKLLENIRRKQKDY